MSVCLRLFLLAVAGGFFSCSTYVYAQDVKSAVRSALESHPTIDGAQASLSAAEHGKDAEISNYYPEISLGLTGGRVYQDNATSRGLSVTRGAAYSGYGEANVKMRQMMFDGKETVNRVGSADARMKSREFMLMDMEEKVTLRAVQGYVEVLRIRAAMDILSRQSESINDYETRITDMVVQGVADEAELQQARDVSMVIDSAWADYEGQLHSAQAAYAEVTGEMPDKDMSEPFSLSSFIDENIQVAVSSSLASIPSLRAAQMDSKAARHDMKAVHGQMYPDVDGELSYLKTDKDDIVGGESKDARAVVRLNWSFSTGGGGFSATRQKKYEFIEAAAKRDALRREIERDIYQAYANYRTFKRKQNLATDRVALNEKLFAAYETQFEGARINLLGLMRAESQLYRALLDESDNKYYLMSSQAGVLASVGTLKQVILNSENGGVH